MKKILLAEDDPFLAKIMLNRLKEEGYDVTHVTDGVAALEKLQKTAYAVLLLDLIMPNMNGFEVLKAIKKAKMKLPVLVFSNLSQQDDEREARALGAKDYFIKSNISIDEVVQAVRRYT